jgi:hypothetical protein
MEPLAAVKGILMLGMTSAALVAIMQHLLKVRLELGRSRAFASPARARDSA